MNCFSSGFLEFDSEAAVQKALAKNGQELLGRPIKVLQSHTQQTNKQRLTKTKTKTHTLMRFLFDSLCLKVELARPRASKPQPKSFGEKGNKRTFFHFSLFYSPFN
jgi:hypothetical protein